jgi:hypothetical protein
LWNMKNLKQRTYEYLHSQFIFYRFLPFTSELLRFLCICEGPSDFP